jgi:ribonucleoside-diphosphate reductase alpha subunit
MLSLNNSEMDLHTTFSEEQIRQFIYKYEKYIDTDWVDLEGIVKYIKGTIPDRISKNDFYNYVADYCVAKTSIHPDYNKLASRICVERLHKSTPEDILDVVEILYNNDGNDNSLVTKSLLNNTRRFHKKLNEAIDMERDYLFDYFGIKTLERSYLLKIHDTNKKKQIIERPQHMIMRVSLGIHGANIDAVLETYDLISQRYFTHATPTLFNAGTNRPQMSSCFLLSIEDDLDNIFSQIKQIALISKWAGGIGVSLSSIRARGSIIKGTNGQSDGIVPLCGVLNKLSKYVNQGGKRPGSIACFVAGTEIFTANGGVKKIEDVKVGDLVVTHENRLQPVEQIHKNPIADRKIYKLEVEKNKDIYVTGNHKFWSFYTKKYKYNRVSLGWNSIDGLKKIMDNKGTTRQACYISAPTETKIVDTKDYKIDVMDYEKIIINTAGTEKDNCKISLKVSGSKISSITESLDKLGKHKVSVGKKVNKVWNITEDFANLVGMWLGDGHLKKTKKNGYIVGIGFTVHKDNKDEIDYITKICKDTFGCKIASFTSKTRNVTHLEINSHIVGSVFIELFGSGFDGKSLPNMIFSWPKNLVNNLMAGLITTDGHIGNANRKCDVSLGLSNEKLMTQLYHLCRANGLDVSFVKGKAGKGMTCNPYSMSIPITKEILDKTHKLYSDDRIKKCYELIEKTKDTQNDKFLKILNITETDRKDQYVYTLGVKDDHSYTVEGLICENCYLETWHADIYDFMELRKASSGNDDNRARDLFLASWIPDLFMKRVEANEKWSLMCPNECPNLEKTHGEEFEKLYLQYEKEKKYRRQVNARDLWKHLLECQMETGFTYMCYKDQCNNKSNQKNMGTIRCSNLCAEIVEYSDGNTTAVCNLASICLPRYIYEVNGEKQFNYELLLSVVRVIIRNLNKIIDLNFYPTESTEKSNKKMRPIGLGVQGLSQVYNSFDFSYESAEASFLNKKIFETIYYGAVDESKELAKKFGHYMAFKGSPFSQGKLQFHLWNLDSKDLVTSKDYNWDKLIEEVKEHGTRNSLLTALMPTAGTSQIMGCYESFEPYISNIFVKTTMAGEFIVINESLVQDLIKLDLWNDDMRKLIIIHNGSVQNIDAIPKNLKEVYKTAFEISLKSMIDQSADRGPFIDQTQSMNLFMKTPKPKTLMSAHFHAWKRGLKTGMYYLRGAPAVNPIQFGIDIADVVRLTGRSSAMELIQGQFNLDTKKNEEPVKEQEGCLMCSS